VKVLEPCAKAGYYDSISQSVFTVGDFGEYTKGLKNFASTPFRIYVSRERESFFKRKFGVLSLIVKILQFFPPFAYEVEPRIFSEAPGNKGRFLGLRFGCDTKGKVLVSCLEHRGVTVLCV